MRYAIVDGGEFIDGDEFDSFSKAVAYAAANEWFVYDCELHRLIYDGYRDEYLIYRD